MIHYIVYINHSKIIQLNGALIILGKLKLIIDFIISLNILASDILVQEYQKSANGQAVNGKIWSVIFFLFFMEFSLYLQSRLHVQS
jgi:hypothetical protein